MDLLPQHQSQSREQHGELLGPHHFQQLNQLLYEFFDELSDDEQQRLRARKELAHFQHHHLDQIKQ